MPQIYTNWQLKSTTGISTHLILFWVLGDAMNLVGCVVLDQQPFQKALGSYFIIVDSMLLLQYFLYKKPKTPTGPPANCISEDTRLLSSAIVNEEMQSASCYTLLLPTEVDVPPYYDSLDKSHSTNIKQNEKKHALSQSARIGALSASVLLGLLWFAVYTHNHEPDKKLDLETFGLLMGWGSSINYHLSRLPQLWYNHKRKSVDGLSLAMFAIIFTANGTYALSLLAMIPVAGPDFLYKSASYIYGPIGSLVIDIFVLLQFFTLRKRQTLPNSMPVTLATSAAVSV
ncbi:PQ loop repeat-containing protein 2 [Coemansia spiralis]|uniref:PQ loop repeat-containing protein 2 n=1 Tax=Coemansia spiralis TaxID=417178 RepID=A0A9W8KZ96_9FUNG|nr:PQ loop repeat-containing protein 2 [Coemansia sp. RSA 1358]KAJ2680538.1 PQ loop repeat-containing protein 2 [Coemansia spiralis]